MTFETIHTKRLRLQALTPASIKTVFEHHSIEEIKKILGHTSEEDYQKEEHKYKNGYSSYNRSFKMFLLTDKASGAVIGRCGIHNWNAEHSRAEIGYVMHDEQFKRKGLMSEAVEAVIDHGFNELNLNRIDAMVGPANIPSLRLMEKFNFVQEGILRQHYWTGSEFEDSVLFSKLLREYRNERR
jgi:ribosomal-protein-alanine N-acetyltransferase